MWAENVLCIKPDTFGDLVLAEPLVRRLRAVWPDCQVRFLVREEYAEIAPLLPRSIQWITTSIDPYGEDPLGNQDALSALLRQLDELDLELVIGGSYQLTWLELVIADRLKGARRISFNDLEIVRAKEPELAAYLDGRLDHLFEESISVDPGLEAWRKWNAIASHLTGITAPDSRPRLSVPPVWLERAETWLRSGEFASLPWIACCPAGIRNAPIKAWPAERFSKALAELWKMMELPVVLMGHVAEREILQAVAEDLHESGVTCRVWVGEKGEIPMLAALMSRSICYFGNDSGPMHIAAALGIPVAAIFGGGTWPRFRPAARRYAIVYQPLECYGCGWECRYLTAPCLSTIPVEPVIEAVERLLENPIEPMSLEIEVDVELRRHGSFEEFSRYHSAPRVDWREKRQRDIERQLRRIDQLDRLLTTDCL